MTKRIFISFFILAACISCGPASKVSGNGRPKDINLGYGSTSREDNTYAVSSVKFKTEEVASYSTIFDYLSRKVPGLQVIGNKVTIRGMNSINGDSTPIFVVDGLTVDDISYISPLDVDNVSVLKDASSSIYGMRGANGVILITTKH